MKQFFIKFLKKKLGDITYLDVIMTYVIFLLLKLIELTIKNKFL